MTHKNNIKDLEKLSFKIEEMGGSEKLKVRKKAGYLNARERIDLFFDKGTFLRLVSLLHHLMSMIKIKPQLTVK